MVKKKKKKNIMLRKWSSLRTWTNCSGLTPQFVPIVIAYMV